MKLTADDAKYLKSTCAKWVSLSVDALGFQPEADNTNVPDFNPLKFGQRVVIRNMGEIPVELIVALHKLYKKDEKRANELLSGLLRGDITSLENIIKYCAVQEIFIRQGFSFAHSHATDLAKRHSSDLKLLSQYGGISPPDPGLTLPTQELFEQFFSEQGLPNDDEKILLQRVGIVSAADLNTWFNDKFENTQAFCVIQHSIKTFPPIASRVAEFERLKFQRLLSRRSY